MTVEEEDVTENNNNSKKKKNVVLVGIRMGQNDRLLLNWTLVKVAEPGDHVVALHVCRDRMSEAENHSLMDDYLQVYKGLCTARQLNLIGKVSHGRSIRKVLVKEARLCEAMTVVVGINSQNSLCGWVSVGSYCAKKLAATTTVFTVYNGKVISQRGFTNQPPGIKGNRPQNINALQPPNTKQNQTSSVVSEVPRLQNPENQLVHNMINLSKDSGGETKPSRFDETSSSSISDGDNRIIETSSLVCEDRDDPIDDLVKEIAEPMPGWPLLKKASSVAPTTGKGPRARKMSVVEWAMSLPRRTSSLPSSSESDIGSSDKPEVLLEKEIAGISNKSRINSLSAWGKLPKELELLLRTNSSGCRWFGHKEIVDATFQFSSENLIAEGGCSCVYKGYLLDGKKVAVKIIRMYEGPWQDYILEVDIISSLKHKHIIPLIGVCIENNDLILVYDFLSNGSLEEHIHGKKKECGLSWEVRFNVAVGVAEALNYLHKECSRPVIHRDIKSSNILLSNGFEPLVSDFGLAIWASTSSSDIHSDVVGTFGYLAPEYFMYGKISEKIDVYSFGVVLLELLSGKKPICAGTLKRQESLVIWAKPILESGDVTTILDPNLSGQIDEVQVQRMIMAVNLCLTRTDRLRPEINQILKLLRGEGDLKEWANFNSKDQAESDNQEDDEFYPDPSVWSHLGVALDDGTTSSSSVDQQTHHTFDYHLRGRCSTSSSFD